jgi:hypothetical protein
MQQKYAVRQELRVAGRYPSLMICGHGGAGKDYAAEYICSRTPLVYSGSTSWLVAPLVAASLGTELKSTFEERRLYRNFWYEFCNEVRKNDPTLLAKMNLAEGDMVVGPRDDFEVYETVSSGMVELVLWIDNPRVTPDPTVKIGPEDCDMTIMNSGGRFDFCRKLDKLIETLKTPYLSTH